LEYKIAEHYIFWNSMSTSNFNSNNFLSDFMITLKNTYSIKDVIKTNLFLILINNNKKSNSIMTTFLIFVIVNKHRKIESICFIGECDLDLTEKKNKKKMFYFIFINNNKRLPLLRKFLGGLFFVWVVYLYVYCNKQNTKNEWNECLNYK